MSKKHAARVSPNESANADSEENIREVTLDMALLNELGSVSCTVFYKFGTYNKNRYQLQIIFQKGESDDGSLLKGMIDAEDARGGHRYPVMTPPALYHQ